LTIKKYLEQYGALGKEVGIKVEQLRKLYAIWMPQATTPKMTQTSQNLNAAFVVIELYYSTVIIRLLQIMLELQLAIDSLDDSIYRIILTEKYINEKQPDDIAVEIPCDVRTVYRWLNEAIDALQAQHPDMYPK